MSRDQISGDANYQNWEQSNEVYGESRNGQQKLQAAIYLEKGLSCILARNFIECWDELKKNMYDNSKYLIKQTIKQRQQQGLTANHLETSHKNHHIRQKPNFSNANQDLSPEHLLNKNKSIRVVNSDTEYSRANVLKEIVQKLKQHKKSLQTDDESNGEIMRKIGKLESLVKQIKKQSNYANQLQESEMRKRMAQIEREAKDIAGSHRSQQITTDYNEQKIIQQFMNEVLEIRKEIAQMRKNNQELLKAEIERSDDGSRHNYSPSYNRERNSPSSYQRQAESRDQQHIHTHTHQMYNGSEREIPMRPKQGQFFGHENTAIEGQIKHIETKLDQILKQMKGNQKAVQQSHQEYIRSINLSQPAKQGRNQSEYQYMQQRQEEERREEERRERERRERERLEKESRQKQMSLQKEEYVRRERQQIKQLQKMQKLVTWAKSVTQSTSLKEQNETKQLESTVLEGIKQEIRELNQKIENYTANSKHNSSQTLQSNNTGIQYQPQKHYNSNIEHTNPSQPMGSYTAQVEQLINQIKNPTSYQTPRQNNATIIGKTSPIGMISDNYNRSVDLGNQPYRPPLPYHPITPAASSTDLQSNLNQGFNRPGISRGFNSNQTQTFFNTYANANNAALNYSQDASNISNSSNLYRQIHAARNIDKQVITNDSRSNNSARHPNVNFSQQPQGVKRQQFNIARQNPNLCYSCGRNCNCRPVAGLGRKL